MGEIIIHHYPQSPVSEKIRKAMGLKKLSWRSAEQTDSRTGPNSSP